MHKNGHTVTVMMIRGVGVITGCVGANRCIFWEKKQPTLAFNLDLRVKFGLKMWTNEAPTFMHPTCILETRF